MRPQPRSSLSVCWRISMSRRTSSPWRRPGTLLVRKTSTTEVYPIPRSFADLRLLARGATAHIRYRWRSPDSPLGHVGLRSSLTPVGSRLTAVRFNLSTVRSSLPAVDWRLTSDGEARGQEKGARPAATPLRVPVIARTIGSPAAPGTFLDSPPAPCSLSHPGGDAQPSERSPGRGRLSGVIRGRGERKDAG